MNHIHQRPALFHTVTVVAAITAASASLISLSLSLPVWAMFVGWIAFFTRGLNTRGTFENLGCVGLGMSIGVVAALGISALAPVTGPQLAVPVIVFLVALLVVSLRALPILNNLLGYFLGLVAWFAAHMEPAVENLTHLFGASMIGSIAGWISHTVPAHIVKKA